MLFLEMHHIFLKFKRKRKEFNLQSQQKSRFKGYRIAHAVSVI